MAKRFKPWVTDDVRNAIKSSLEAAHISGREASRAIGAGVTYLGDILDGGNRAPDPQRLEKLADFLGVTFSQLTGGAAKVSSGISTAGLTDTNRKEHYANGTTVPLLSVRTSMGVPSMGEVFQPLLDSPVGFVPNLPALEHVRDAYAFTIPNDLNSPRYMAGEVIYISPVAVPRVGDFVFLRLKDGTAGATRLVAMGEDRVGVSVLNGRKVTFTLDKIDALHRIVASVS